MIRLAKELSWTIPTSRKINRGKQSLEDLKDYMIKKGFSKLIIVETWKGNPGRLLLYLLKYGALDLHMKILLAGTSLQLDTHKMNIKLSQLSLEADDSDDELANFSSKLDEFLETPIMDPRREGLSGVLKIFREGSHIVAIFKDVYGKNVYPKLRVKRWVPGIASK